MKLGRPWVTDFEPNLSYKQYITDKDLKIKILSESFQFIYHVIGKVKWKSQSSEFSVH